MTEPLVGASTSTQIDATLAQLGNGELGWAIGKLTDSGGQLTGYLVMNFEKSDKFRLSVDQVTILDRSAWKATIKKYNNDKHKQVQKTVPKPKPKPKDEQAPVLDVAQILAEIDVGPQDTALSYATELVKVGRAKFRIDFSVPDNVSKLWNQFVSWAERNDKPITGIDQSNLMARIEGELFHITQGKLKHPPFLDARDESAAIEAGYKRQKKVGDPSKVTPKALDKAYFGKYAYHTTSFINLFIIAGSGLLRNAGGSPGGSCYLAEDIDQRDDSITHSKQVIAAALGRFALNTYINQREDRADKVVHDDDTARRGKESELQSDLDEHAALLRFKITPDQLWVTDPQDSRAILLSSVDVAPQELECLTTEGWVPLPALKELGPVLGYADREKDPRIPEFEVFVRQSERVLWRLNHEPKDNDILEGEAFVERGVGLLANKIPPNSTQSAQVDVIIKTLLDKLSTLPKPKRATKMND